MDNKQENFFKICFQILDSNLKYINLDKFSEPISEVKAILAVLSKRKLITLKKGVALVNFDIKKPIIESVDEIALVEYLLNQKGYSDFLLTPVLIESQLKKSYFNDEEIYNKYLSKAQERYSDFLLNLESIENELKESLKNYISSKIEEVNSLKIISQTIKRINISSNDMLKIFERVNVGTGKNLISFGSVVEDDGESSYVYIKDEKMFKHFINSSRFSNLLNETHRWKCVNCSGFLEELIDEDIENKLNDFKLKKYKICKKCKVKNYFKIDKNNKMCYLSKK